MGTIFPEWDNGRSLGVVPGEDSFRKLTQEEIEAEDVYKRQVRRGRAYLCGDLANALIDVIEKAVQIPHDTIDEQTFQPVSYTHLAGSHRRQPAVFNFLHGLCPPFRVPPASGQYGPKW